MERTLVALLIFLAAEVRAIVIIMKTAKEI